MGWQDDDFPEENTDPSLAQPVRTGALPQQGGPSTGGHAAVQQPYPQQGGYPPQQQPGGYPPQQQPGHPQQPQYSPQGQPQQGGWPMTGQFSQVPGQQQQGNQGGYGPQTGNFQAPQTGGYPVAPNTGGYPQASPSGSVPILQAPVVAPVEEARASRVVYGLSGTAAGGIIGVILGVLNTVLEGQTITEGTEFIFLSAIWFAFIVGALAFWKPERFDNAIERFSNRE